MPDRDGDPLYNELDGLYGKLDKLLGKRGPDALVRQPDADADFPVLTEVVEEPGALPSAPKAPPPPASPVSGAAECAVPQDLPPEVMAAVEARLFELLARQQQEVDEAVRRIVREELAKRGLR